ncbi:MULTISPECIES: tyrosine-type recombinase/integrase [Nonomuraea]|uniref:Tyrosine-type recombinase/integrase n=1 Tax=Nonomuraea mangrovi TaxID=2316207 RepID=A0ABW4T1R4_9ACTN
MLTRSSLPLRERTLFRLLYESAARAEEVLALDADELDLRNRRAKVRRKGGAVDVIVWRTATARLLPRLLNGRAAVGRSSSPIAAPASSCLPATWMPAPGGRDCRIGARLSCSRPRPRPGGRTVDAAPTAPQHAHPRSRVIARDKPGDVGDHPRDTGRPWMRSKSSSPIPSARLCASVTCS